MTRFTFDNHRLTIENIGDADRAVVEIEIDSQDGDGCYASVDIPDTEVPRIASALLDVAGYEVAPRPEPETSAMKNLVEGWDNVRSLYHSALSKWLADNLDEKAEGITQAQKRYQYDEGHKDGYAEGYEDGHEAGRRKARLIDELTRMAFEDGAADEANEYVNTRPKYTPELGDRVAGRAPMFTYRGTGEVIGFDGDGCAIVKWDKDNSYVSHADWELEKVEDKSKPKFSPGDRVYRRLFPHHGHGTVHYVRKDGTPRVLWDAEPANFHDPNLLEKVGEWL